MNSNNKKSLKTIQQETEIRHKKKFKKNLKKYGLKILKECDSTYNRNNFTSADFLCEVISADSKFGNLGDKVSISLKTQGGSFTLLNSGVRLTSNMFKGFNYSASELDLIKDCQNQVNELKNTTSLSHYKDVPEIKTAIKELYTAAFLKLFKSNRKLIIHLYNRLNHHQSDFIIIGDKIEKTTKWEIKDFTVKKIKNDTVQVGHFYLRFKAEGSKVKSSWKINVELKGSKTT